MKNIVTKSLLLSLAFVSVAFPGGGSEKREPKEIKTVGDLINANKAWQGAVEEWKKKSTRQKVKIAQQDKKIKALKAELAEKDRVIANLEAKLAEEAGKQQPAQPAQIESSQVEGDKKEQEEKRFEESSVVDSTSSSFVGDQYSFAKQIDDALSNLSEEKPVNQQVDEDGYSFSEQATDVVSGLWDVTSNIGMGTVGGASDLVKEHPKKSLALPFIIAGTQYVRNNPQKVKDLTLTGLNKVFWGFVDAFDNLHGTNWKKETSNSTLKKPVAFGCFLYGIKLGLLDRGYKKTAGVLGSAGVLAAGAYKNPELSTGLVSFLRDVTPILARFGWDVAKDTVKKNPKVSALAGGAAGSAFILNELNKIWKSRKQIKRNREEAGAEGPEVYKPKLKKLPRRKCKQRKSKKLQTLGQKDQLAPVVGVSEVVDFNLM